MAPQEGHPAGVVDSECLVYGVEGLRVIGWFVVVHSAQIAHLERVDTSIITVPIGANPQAPIYALAEAMATHIIEQSKA